MVDHRRPRCRTVGRDPIKLYAVEANGSKVANMRIHYTDNGFDPTKHTLVKAIVGAHDGYALFPLGDASGDWGASAVFTKNDEARVGYEKVRSTKERKESGPPIVDLREASLHTHK